MKNSRFCHNCFANLSADERCKRCGYDNSLEKRANNAISAGEILNEKYMVGKVLGSGGFGITYKALDITENKVVAIKEYVPANTVYRDIGSNDLIIKTSNNRTVFNDGMHSFISEANFLVMFKNVKQVVDIYDCFDENGTAYFSMEYLSGKQLGKFSDKNISEICDLKPIHEKKVVHRDISPQNIIVLNNSDIKLIDFGNARYFNKNNENDDKLVLKPGFSPPELYMKSNVLGPWTDIYSLAATIYSLITGTKLPDALERINGKRFIPIKNYVPDLDYNIEYAVNKALQLDYFKRQKSMDEFIDDIKNSSKFISAQTEHYGIQNDIFAESKNIYEDNEEYNRYNMKLVDSGIDSEAVKNLPNGGNKVNGKKFFAKRLLNIKQIKNKVAGNKGRLLSYDGRAFFVKDADEIVIGRNPSTSDVVINDNNISRKHCTVEYDALKKEFYITDWSTNGTYFSNGLRLHIGVKYSLSAGSEFYL